MPKAGDHGVPLDRVHSEMEQWELVEHLHTDHHFSIPRGEGGSYAQRVHARLHRPVYVQAVET